MQDLGKSFLQRLLTPKSKIAPRSKHQHKPNETRLQSAVRKQRDEREHAARVYAELVAYKLRTLRDNYPNADRYVKLLERIAPDTVAYSRRNCDIDLGDVARRLQLSAIPGTYDKFLIVECTLAWLADLAKAQKTYSLDDADIWGPPEPETIDDLKEALGLN